MAAKAKHPETLTVYPAHPESYPDEYVPGVGIDGTELPWDDAQALIETGLVTADIPPDEETDSEAEVDAEAAPTPEE